MKKILMILSSLLISLTLLLFQISATAAPISSVSHIHNLIVFGSEVLLGTHEGLYKLIDQTEMKLISRDKFDVMGLSVMGKKLIASGHPGKSSTFPEPLGLLSSKNDGKTWAEITLQGKVDFHLLESNSIEIYGVDSQSGDLLFSNNSGRSWKSLGANRFSDIAPSQKISGYVIAITEGRMLFSKNSLHKTQLIKTNFKATHVEWVHNSIFALSDNDLYESSNFGKSWNLIFRFDRPVTVFSANEKIMVATQGAKVLKSYDAGKTFEV